MTRAREYTQFAAECIRGARLLLFKACRR